MNLDLICCLENDIKINVKLTPEIKDKKKIDINKFNGWRLNCFYLNYFIEINDTKMSKFLINLNCPVNKYSMYWATYNNNLEITEQLVKKNCEIYEYAIVSACRHNNLKMVELLINYSQDFIKSSECFVHALKNGTYELFDLLIKEKFEIKSCIFELCKTPEIVKKLIDAGGVIDNEVLVYFKYKREIYKVLKQTEFYKNRRKFRKACKSNDIEIVKQIINYIDESDFYYACKKGKIEVIKLLLENNVYYDYDKVYNLVIKNKELMKVFKEYDEDGFSNYP